MIELSVVLASDDYASIGTALRAFRSQGDPARLQIVIAAMNGAVLGLGAPELDGFPHVTIVNADVRAGINIGRAEAAAMPATTAPFVVFAEGCAYPGRGFVDAIVAAAASGKGDVIGAVLENANPDTATSWAAMRINYGRWLDDATPGAVTDVAGHNSAYRREAVLSLGDELSDVMQSLTAVQQELRARGGVVYLETSARVRMLNISRPGWYLVDQFGKGRQFATHRCRRWPWLRRLAYAAGTPLVPLLRFARIAAALRTTGQSSHLWQGARPLMVTSGLVASAVGECVGYLVRGHAGTGFYERNLRRAMFVRVSDRAHADPHP